MNSSELLSSSRKDSLPRIGKRLRQWQGFELQDGTVTCRGENGALAFSFVSDRGLRVRAWLGEYRKDRETGIVEPSGTPPPEVEARLTPQGTLEIQGGRLTVLVNTRDFTSEVLLDGRFLSGDRAPIEWSRGGFTLTHRLEEGENIYGMGEKTGFLDKRGKSYEMWNSDVYSAHTATTDPLYVSVPFLTRLGRNYACGFYLDNSWRTRFDLGEEDPGTMRITAPGGNLDYYLLGGRDLREVLPQYGALTGSPALPPRWALSHHQSRYSYKTEAEVREIARGFTERNLPCASIHLDIHYMDGNRTFTWDEDAFCDPAALAAELKASGIRLTAIVDPAIKADPEYETYRELIAEDYECRYADGKPYVGEVWPGKCVFPDFVRSEVRKWWGQKVVDFMDHYGVEGIWHDMNEPAVFNDESTMDVTVCHGREPLDSHARYHNLYGYFECMATYEAIRGARRTRPFILSRAGFAGMQKYAALWTGDNRSMWEHLELSLPMLLNLGMSALPFVGADIGGFSYNAAPELLCRWYQLGMFYPFARNHCAEHARRQELWAFGPETEEIASEALRLRERLMPDLYTSFYLARRDTAPVLRALVWDYPEDPECRHIHDQFLFAQGLMGAPVLRPGQRIRQVYLPGGEWFDWHTRQALDGGQWILAEAPLERMPLFVRSGTATVTDEGVPGELRLTLWLDDTAAEGRWVLYSDDGETLEHEAGAFCEDTLEWTREGPGLRLRRITRGEPAFRSFRKLSVEIRGSLTSGLASWPCDQEEFFLPLSP